IFRIRQCVGILGGRPGHALWIIGVAGDSAICLDPHVNQPFQRIPHFPPSDPTSSTATTATSASSPQCAYLQPDHTYHCAQPICVPLERLDPSIALGFVCPTLSDFEEFCDTLTKLPLAMEDVRNKSDTSTSNNSGFVVRSDTKPNQSSPSTSLTPRIIESPVHRSQSFFSLFEIHPTRPAYLPPFPGLSSTADFTNMLASPSTGLLVSDSCQKNSVPSASELLQSQQQFICSFTSEAKSITSVDSDIIRSKLFIYQK
ncbi:unnamed protein product, partial [Protopolystoma xenopodis]